MLSGNSGLVVFWSYVAISCIGICVLPWLLLKVKKIRELNSSFKARHSKLHFILVLCAIAVVCFLAALIANQIGERYQVSQAAGIFPHLPMIIKKWKP